VKISRFCLRPAFGKVSETLSQKQAVSNPSYLGAGDTKIAFQSKPGQKCKNLSEKQTERKRIVGVFK
jgi:hypothetical protein